MKKRCPKSTDPKLSKESKKNKQGGQARKTNKEGKQEG
jgi:hypothetical protein